MYIVSLETIQSNMLYVFTLKCNVCTNIMRPQSNQDM